MLIVKGVVTLPLPSTTDGRPSYGKPELNNTCCEVNGFKAASVPSNKPPESEKTPLLLTGDDQ